MPASTKASDPSGREERERTQDVLAKRPQHP
jgi:hypothetical protein